MDIDINFHVTSSKIECVISLKALAPNILSQTVHVVPYVAQLFTIVHNSYQRLSY